MNTKFFGLFDKVGNAYVAFEAEVNATTVVRSFLNYCRVIPMKDLEIRELGEIKDNVISIYKKFNTISWSTYELPKDQDEAVAPMREGK